MLKGRPCAFCSLFPKNGNPNPEFSEEEIAALKEDHDTKKAHADESKELWRFARKTVKESEDDRKRKASLPGKMFEYVMEHPEFRFGEVSKAVGEKDWHGRYAYHVLTRWRKHGHVRRVSRGKYEIVRKGAEE